ncbi:FK506-binding protein 15-like isoform X2 [Triticum dicoccoides]|nr:FK506-binding protein 15-like isoform X2 [Triticum dicoccoides]
MAESRTPAVVGRKLQIRRKTCSVDMRSAHLNLGTPELMSPMMTDFESPQIKASRDVANVMAAKVKLLQRELKTVNADLAFSKERCAQLEEETRLHRAGNHDHAANEDLVRKQLETLLAEKARLATENTVYARENRFLREIVDLNQLTVVGLQEDIIEEEEEEEEYEEEEEEEYEEEEEEAEHDTPATKGTAPPQPPSHHTNNVPVAAPQPPSRRTGNAAVPAPQSPSRRTENAPVAAPQSPTRRADNVPVATPNPPSLCTDNAPESRSTDNTAIGVAGSPMHRSPKEDEGSQQTNPIRDNCSPEKASQQQQCQD